MAEGEVFDVVFRNELGVDWAEEDLRGSAWEVDVGLGNSDREGGFLVFLVFLGTRCRPCCWFACWIFRKWEVDGFPGARPRAGGLVDGFLGEFLGVWFKVVLEVGRDFEISGWWGAEDACGAMFHPCVGKEGTGDGDDEKDGESPKSEDFVPIVVAGLAFGFPVDDEAAFQRAPVEVDGEPEVEASEAETEEGEIRSAGDGFSCVATTFALEQPAVQHFYLVEK